MRTFFPKSATRHKVPSPRWPLRLEFSTGRPKYQDEQQQVSPLVARYLYRS